MGYSRAYVVKAGRKIEGSDKKKWTDVGAIIKDDETGNVLIMLENLPLHAIEPGKGIVLNCFIPKKKEEPAI